MQNESPKATPYGKDWWVRLSDYESMRKAYQSEIALLAGAARPPYDLSHITCACGHTSAVHSTKTRKCMLPTCTTCQGYSGDTENKNDLSREA